MHKLVIICVDDEQTILDSLKIELETALSDEYIIETAESGQEALELLSELLKDNYSVAVAIADYIMPGMKGDELLIKIHEQDPKILKIMLTGQADIEAVGNAVNAANLYRYIAKPWDGTDLILTLREALRSYKQDRELEKQHKILQQLNASLEQQVEERTAKLKQEIADRLSAERKLQSLNEDLMRSNEDLEQFAYVISHDLQQPLQSIIGFGQILMLHYQEILDAEGKDCLSTLVNSGLRMRQMIRDLLTYSRVGTEGKKLVPTDCNKVLEKVLANLHRSISQKHANLICAPLPRVMGNETQLLQLFQNLIGNAIKFSRPAFSPQITISVESEGERWRFAIQDNGIGISPENFNRIFGIFQRLETGTEYPGTGIGLASCKKIVQRHGGRIWVESELGVGTIFYFTLMNENKEKGI